MKKLIVLFLILVFFPIVCWAGPVWIADSQENKVTVTSNKLDTTSNLPSSATADVVTVTSTRRALANSQTVYAVRMRATTGNIFIGGSAVTAANGFILATSEVVTLQTDNLSNIYVIANDTSKTLSFIADVR